LRTRVQLLSLPATDEFRATQLVKMSEATGHALRTEMMERGVHSAYVLRYFAVSTTFFWARLVVDQVLLDGERLEPHNVATMYYITDLAMEAQLGKDVWSRAALDRIDQEISASFVELSDMWARIAADSPLGADVKGAWKTLPVLPKQQEGWTFRCGMTTNCKVQRLVKLSESRAWISSYEGPVRASVACVRDGLEQIDRSAVIAAATAARAHTSAACVAEARHRRCCRPNRRPRTPRPFRA
jgi:hypothetical protein